MHQFQVDADNIPFTNRSEYYMYSIRFLYCTCTQAAWSSIISMCCN